MRKGLLIPIHLRKQQLPVRQRVPHRVPVRRLASRRSLDHRSAPQFCASRKDIAVYDLLSWIRCLFRDSSSRVISKGTTPRLAILSSSPSGPAKIDSERQRGQRSRWLDLENSLRQGVLQMAWVRSFVHITFILFCRSLFRQIGQISASSSKALSLPRSRMWG